jgi:dynein heavy chain 1
MFKFEKNITGHVQKYSSKLENNIQSCFSIFRAYITATRQCVAQANSWSLEELYLDIYIGDTDDTISMDDFSFGIEKLKLQGAACVNNELQICSSIMTDLHVARLRWLNKTQVPQGIKGKKDKTIKLPVYLNATRSEVLFTADFSIANDHDQQVYYERGVALIASTTLN